MLSRNALGMTICPFFPSLTNFVFDIPISPR
jgi:hypothetical protein